jgi:gliding motility-associated-like protein
VVIGGLFNDSDPNGDSISITSLPCPPANGTATITNAGTITYTPNTNFVGVDSFCYVICDNGVPGLCDTAWVYVTVTGEDVVVVPSGFTPNNDGDNDVFEVLGIDRFPNNSILVFNRWGNVVFEKEGYLNTWGGTWDRNDEPLPDGTYFYVLDLKDGSKPRSGFVVMFR